MAQTRPRTRIIVALKANTRWCVAFIAAVNLLLRLGWRPSFATSERLAEIAGKLIWIREVIETEPKDGWLTFRPGRMSVSQADGASAQ
jgi:hypothetical protein